MALFLLATGQWAAAIATGGLALAVVAPVYWPPRRARDPRQDGVPSHGSRPYTLRVRVERPRPFALPPLVANTLIVVGVIMVAVGAILFSLPPPAAPAVAAAPTQAPPPLAPTATAEPSPTSTAEPTATVTPSPEPTATSAPTVTPTPEPTLTSTPESTATASPTSPPPTSTPFPTRQPLPSSDERVEEAVIIAINELRAQNGCNVQLRYSAQLTAAARRHSDDMARSRFFGHIGSDDSDRISRAREAGYVGLPNTRVRENLVGNLTDARSIVDLWLNDDDPWHRIQMLDCVYNDIGVGYIRLDGSVWTHYITAKFGVGP